jgi:hypothetical protein
LPDFDENARIPAGRRAAAEITEQRGKLAAEKNENILAALVQAQDLLKELRRREINCILEIHVRAGRAFLVEAPDKRFLPQK